MVLDGAKLDREALPIRGIKPSPLGAPRQSLLPDTKRSGGETCTPAATLQLTPLLEAPSPLPALRHVFKLKLPLWYLFVTLCMLFRTN